MSANFGQAEYGLDEYGKVVVPPIEPDLDANYGIAGFGRSAYGQAETEVFRDPRNCLFSLSASKKLSTGGLGFRGIYQGQVCSRGRFTRKLKLYVPTNRRTEAQQAHRQLYGQAVGAWRNLTSQQKSIYNERAEGKPYSGYNLFIKEHLLSN